MSRPFDPLPCPFCGASGYVVPRWDRIPPRRGDTPVSYFVQCGDDNCLATCKGGWTEAEAIESWNARLPSPSTVQIAPHLAIRAVPNHGAFSRDAIRELVSVASAIGAECRMDFNGSEVTASPGSDPDVLWDEFLADEP